MNKVIELLSLWWNVFKKPKRLMIVLLITLMLYLFNAVISNFSNILWVYGNEGLFSGSKIFSMIILGFHRSILPSSVFTIIVIGLLTGVLISLLLYRSELSIKNKKVGLFAGIGLFLGILAPGCAACGIGLIGLLGLGSSLASLPLNGSEISYLAIIIILFSIIRISIKMTNACEITPNNSNPKNERRFNKK